MSDNTVSEGVLAAIDASVQRAVDAAVDAAVQRAVDAAMAKWTNKIQGLENEIASLKLENTKLQETISENAAKSELHTMDLESFQETQTNQNEELSKIATTTAINAIDQDVYSRKWNLIINGLPGTRGEPEGETEAKVRKMAATALKITKAENRAEIPFAACHRLSQKEDAGIIIKFVNLADRNSWLSQAKELKHSAVNLSISTDLPPVLKPLKADILDHRRKLQAEAKKKSKIIYSKSWPYMTLQLPNGSQYSPKITLSDIVKRFHTPISSAK